MLRGPQGTLYGRNATAGVVNLVSAKPTDQFEAMASADIGNYQNRRLEGMINVPIVDDRLDLRVAGEWTKRKAIRSTTLTDQPHRRPRSVVQPRDARLEADREICRPISSGSISPKTTIACAQPSSFAKPIRRRRQIDGVSGCSVEHRRHYRPPSDYLSQGCLASSLYSPDAFEVPNGYRCLMYRAARRHRNAVDARNFDPYASTTQSKICA